MPKCYKFSRGIEKKFPKMAALIDFSKYNHDQLTVHSDTYYPLIIVMVGKIVKKSIISIIGDWLIIRATHTILRLGDTCGKIW